MANKVWFQDANGNEQVIKNTAMTWEEVDEVINIFIRRCNVNKINQAKRTYGDQYDESKVPLFKRYYTRCWKMEDGRTKIDVGSHTEFFIWENKYLTSDQN